MPKRSLADLVLDTIDIISARKNRPNLFRIYRHLHRLYDLSLQTCEQLIQTLLIQGKVIRVTYKGHISYRNAIKWKKYSYYMKKNMGSELPGSLITNAISELIFEEPDYLHMGVPYNILEKHLLTMKGLNMNREIIQIILQRELKLESLKQYDNGNYFLGPKPPKAFSSEKMEMSTRLENMSSELVTNRASTESLYNVINREESSSCLDSKPENNDYSFNVISNNNNNIGENSFLLSDINSVNNEPNLNDKIDFVDSESLSESDNIQSSPSDVSVVNGSVEESSQDISHDKKCHRPSDFGQDTDLEEPPQVSCSTLNDMNQIDNSNSATSDMIGNPSEVDMTSISSGGEEHTEKTHENRLVESSDEAENDFSNANSPDHPDDSKTNSNSSPVNGGKEPINSLVLERAKRKKKTNFDESFYYFPSLRKKARDADTEKDDKRKRKRKRNSSTNMSMVFAKRLMFSGNNIMCCVCQRYESKEKCDSMVYCATCSNQGHQSCALKTMNGKEWSCLDCHQRSKVVCSICRGSSDDSQRGQMHKCSLCGDHYHKDCHKPTIFVPVSSSWQCWACLPNKLDEYFEGDPPDFSSWTTEDVYKYFKNHFEEAIAKDLQQQDIDGEALKLMDRSDVLSLNFNLGIRLKILMHVRRLQLRTNSLTDLWDS